MHTKSPLNYPPYPVHTEGKYDTECPPPPKHIPESTQDSCQSVSLLHASQQNALKHLPR